MNFLSIEDWTERAEAHRKLVSPIADAFLRRRATGQKHPVYDPINLCSKEICVAAAIDSKTCKICVKPVINHEASSVKWWKSVNIGTIEKVLPCGHVFHRNCIVAWAKKNQGCPAEGCSFSIEGRLPYVNIRLPSGRKLEPLREPEGGKFFINHEGDSILAFSDLTTSIKIKDLTEIVVRAINCPDVKLVCRLLEPIPNQVGEETLEQLGALAGDALVFDALIKV